LLLRLKNNLDFVALALILAAFVALAARRLETVPVPEIDEASTLQVAYELLNHGQISLPMHRFLGGNIENSWHSYTPVYFVTLSGFLKIAGWGLLQGRIFNLLTAVLLLIAVHAVGRRLFDWRVGLTAVFFLVSDPTFFERSRLIRNDFAAAALAMLAYWLYENARQKQKTVWYVASGVAAGAGVMSHTNALYMFIAIALLIALEGGWRTFKEKRIYVYGLSALAVMAYEIVYDLIDYKNFVLQNRDDRLHFGIFESMDIWRNILHEPGRYAKWHTGGALFHATHRIPLHIFEVVAALSIIYLMVVVIRNFRNDLLSRSETRLLILTLICVVFHAAVVSHKNVYYMAHLAPWFALCAGAGVAAMFDWTWAQVSDRQIRAATRVALTATVLVIALFIVEVFTQGVRYFRAVGDFDFPSFDLVRSALREAVPDGLCPVAIKAPVFWLAFPEQDRCFASIEPRMNSVDLEGQEYAVLAQVVNKPKRLHRMEELEATYPLISELRYTPYGDIRVYYTGTNANLVKRPPAHYYFLRGYNGFVTDQEIDNSLVIWSKDLSRLRPDGTWKIQRHFKANVQSAGAYVLKVELSPEDRSVQKLPVIVITERRTDMELGRVDFRKEASPALAVFRTRGVGSIRVSIKWPIGKEGIESVPSGRATLIEIR